MAEHTAQLHPLVERFPMDAASTEPHEVERYFQNRAVQLLSRSECVPAGWKFTGKYERLEWGAITSAVHQDDPSKVYHTAYIYSDKRAQGVFTSWIKSRPDHMIVTTPDCGLEAFLTKHSVPYAVARKPQFEEYEMVEAFYGNKVTRRSGVHLINHIDEGLYILKRIGASEWAQRAYAIHPILQGDDELVAFWSSDQVDKLDRKVVLLGVEYRSTANNYLSFKSATEQIKLSPITDVNHMLVADKVQNRKDFEIYHKGTHPRSDRLDEYFRQWLDVLGVSEEQYQALRLEILERTTLPTPIGDTPPTGSSLLP